MFRNTVLILVVAIAAGCLPATTASAAAYKPSDAEVLRDRVISKLVAWRPKSGETILRKATDLESTQPYLTAEALLMATYSLDQDPKTVDRALTILNKQVEKDPADPVAEFYRGEVLRWLDRDDEAQASWQKAKAKAAAQAKENSRNATAQFYLGAALVRLKQTDEARKALKKASKADFEKPMIDFQMGLSYLIDNNWKAAKASFDDVHELDPRYAHLYYFRGLASDKLGHKDQLLDDLDQFVKLAPNSPEAKKARAILNR